MNCKDTIDQLVSGPGISPLNPNTLTNFTLNPVQNAVFQIDTPSQQNIVFNIYMQSTGSGSTVTATLSIHDLNNNGASVGSINLTQSYTTFTRDLPTGSYAICIRTVTGSYHGEITGVFLGYPDTARMSVEFGTGNQFVPTVAFHRPDKVCDEPLFFEILEGQVPPGITMTPLGMLEGVLPNLDCVDPHDQFSPAQNWYFTMGGQVLPWGRRWRFKVKVHLSNYEESFAIKWFCIRVVNNWSLDRDNFIAQMPFRTTKTLKVFDPPETLPQLCMEPCDEEPEPFVPQSIDELCPDCDNPAAETDVELIPIPEIMSARTPTEFEEWYRKNADRDMSDECPSLQKFMKDLKSSEMFLRLIKRNGLEEDLDPKQVEKEQLILSQYQNFLQVTSSRMIDGKNPDDLDYLMTKWKDEQNQKLPITAITMTGNSMKTDLTRTNKVLV